MPPALRSGQAPGEVLNSGRGALTPSERYDRMNQGSRLFDELGRLMNEAAGVAGAARREVEAVVRAQVERFVNDLELVKREDFDVLREQVQIQSEEIDQLRKELAALKTEKTS